MTLDSDLNKLASNYKNAIIKIYPTITNGLVKIEICNYFGKEINIEVVSLDGTVLVRRKLYYRDKTMLDLSKLVPGFYVLKIYNDGILSQIERISIIN